MTDVDLVVNVWERTWRNVIRPGYFPAIEEQNGRDLKKILLINNVFDQRQVESAAENLMKSGEINGYYWVEKELPRALRVLGLRTADLGRIPYYSSPFLVALTTPGNDWLLHWDAEIELVSRYNWVDSALDLMKGNPNIYCANPAWIGVDEIAAEALAMRENFTLGYGFSDQCFLVRRSDLIQQDWRCRCLASLRYPLAHIAPYFEQRVDAYMRRKGLLRATCLSAIYTHPNEGASYPPCSFQEKFRRMAYNVILRVLDVLPVCNPCVKVNPGPHCQQDLDRKV